MMKVLANLSLTFALFVVIIGMTSAFPRRSEEGGYGFGGYGFDGYGGGRPGYGGGYFDYGGDYVGEGGFGDSGEFVGYGSHGW